MKHIGIVITILIMRLHKQFIINNLTRKIMETKAPKKHYTWYAPEGYWYTQRSVEDEHQRMFVRAISGKTENTINNWVLWTDEQKAEWEELWLTEPEGESK